MMRYQTEKIVKKSTYWHRHGKHQPIDPVLLRRFYPDRVKRDDTRWFGSVTDLFADMRKRGDRGA